MDSLQSSVIKLMGFSGTDFKKMMLNMLKEIRLVFPAEKFIMQKIAHETFQNSFSKDVYGLEGRGRFYAGEELDVSPSTHLAIRMHCTIYCTNSSPKAASKFCFLPNPWKKLAPKRLITIKLVCSTHMLRNLYLEDSSHKDLLFFER